MEEQNRELQSKTKQGKSEHDEAERFGALQEQSKSRAGTYQEHSKNIARTEQAPHTISSNP